MRIRVISVMILLLSCAWTYSPIELDEDIISSQTQTNQFVNWNLNDRPIPQSGWSTQLWQPQPTGMLWEVDFSPNGELIAAVDISTNLLSVWNSSDGRVVFHAPHSNSLVDIVWLNDDYVLVADSGSRWYSYNIIDDGGFWPMNGTNSRNGQWTGDLTGDYPGSLWGIDITYDRSRVVFCGFIDDPNIGGEIVVADTQFFIDGSESYSRHVYTTDWGTDCAISDNGTFVASLNRIQGQTPGSYHDTVSGWNVENSNLVQTWNRNVAGGHSMAWAIDFSPQGHTYTVAYNRPSEGVVTDFFTDSGTINWYTPISQNVSSLRWSPLGNGLAVGLHNPGRLLIMDSGGGILGDYGWHATVWNNKPYPSDITGIAIDNQGVQFATVGKDGAVEIHLADTNLQLSIHRRHSSDYLREIEVHSSESTVAFAESNGVISLRDLLTGKLLRQCFHPDFDQPIDEYPFAKSVVLKDEMLIGGFSDGTILACDSDGKEMWSWRIPQQHPSFESFGRIDIHPLEDFLAISWTQNYSSSGFASKVSILDIGLMSEVISWGYGTEYWPLEFSSEGSFLASSAQNGSVRLWVTEDPNPLMWSDQGVIYSHSNYTGIISWHNELPIFMSVGWDSQAILWDAETNMQLSQFQFTGEGFGAILADDNLFVASGEASDSSLGRLEIYDGIDFTNLGSWTIDGIPRGLSLGYHGEVILANHTGSWWVLIADSDSDGVIDSEDEFPNNPLQWIDTDGDGYGDNNAPGAGGDGCSNTWGTSTSDRRGCPDSDGDQWSDPDENWPACVLGAGYGDAWPNNPNQWCDSDGDGIGDEYSYETGISDGLRFNESGDAFPNDSAQWSDRDGDMIGDNYSYDLGTDGLRTNQIGDAFPENILQHQDTDGDGWGDIYSWTEGPNGLRIEGGDAFFLDPLAWSDIDGDGCPTASSTGLSIDNHPTDPTRCDDPMDFDLPGQLNLDASGSNSTWSISVDWKSVAETTESVSIYGLSWNYTGGIEHLMLNLEPPGASAWWSKSEFDKSELIDNFERQRADNHDRLTLRLISVSQDNQKLEYWVNFTYEAELFSDLPTAEDMQTCQGCCGETYQIPISETCDVVDCSPCGEEGTTSGSDAPSIVAWSTIVIGLITIILLSVLVIRRLGNKPSKEIDNVTVSNYAPCTTCGGPAHEAVNNGNKWTWCPTCRQWLNYIGKA